MSQHDQEPSPVPDDGVDAGLRELMAGPSAVNMVHGAIELGGANAEERPSQACIDAARGDILAALWGPGL